MAEAPPYSRSSGWATTARARSQSSGNGSSGASAPGTGLRTAPGDHPQAQDLVGALEDRQHAGVDEVAGHRVLLGVAVAAVDLHRLPGDPLGRLAHVGLD